jgi:iron complex transport system substrate-binding protein
MDRKIHPMAEPRVISLLASATEIVCALGARSMLVGRSHECDFPADVRRLPAVSRPRIDPARPSAVIDGDVRTLLEQALSIYAIDSERLVALAPDVLITQTQCEVCAVSLADVERALAAWTGRRPSIVALAPFALADIFADIARIGQALGRDDAALELVADMRARIEAIADAADGLPRPRVAAIEWIDPPMAAGNWMPELIALAGGASVFGEPGRHSPWLDLDALAAAEPDVIVILPCGFDIARTRVELPALTRRKQWRGLRAVANGAVFLLDGNQYFNRPGPRLVESLEILAEILHPKRFPSRHEGSGWIGAKSAG